MNRLTITLYSSSFCGACSATRHTLSRAAELLGDRIVLREVNVADDAARAEEAQISSTPTVVMHSPEGAEVMRATGAPTLNQVLTAVAGTLG